MSDHTELASADTGLVLCDDLMFVSRITGTARSLGLSLKSARSADAMLELAKQQNPGGVVVDLSNPGLDIAAFIERLRGMCSAMPRVVAFGSHVDGAALKAARTAGCDVVLPRSQFVEQLPHALPAWLSPPAD